MKRAVAAVTGFALSLVTAALLLRYDEGHLRRTKPELTMPDKAYVHPEWATFAAAGVLIAGTA